MKFREANNVDRKSGGSPSTVCLFLLLRELFSGKILEDSGPYSQRRRK